MCYVLQHYTELLIPIGSMALAYLPSFAYIWLGFKVDVRYGEICSHGSGQIIATSQKKKCVAEVSENPLVSWKF